MVIGRGSPGPLPIRLFYSYSHRDEEHREDLEEHLALLKAQGLIDVWHDRRIGAGQEWEGAIDENLEAANVILLLVSSSFLASHYCYDKEMKRALEKHEAGDARVIPIIVRPVDWDGSRFGKLQALPKNWKPVTSWSNRDEAWVDVARGLRQIIEELKEQAEVQRAKAQKILIPMAIQELVWIDSMEEMAAAGNALQFSPIGTEPLPDGFVDARSQLPSWPGTI